MPKLTPAPPRPRMPADPKFQLREPPSGVVAEPEAGKTREEVQSLYWQYDGGGFQGPLGEEDPSDAGYDIRVGTSRPSVGRVRRTSAPDGNLSRKLASSMVAALSAPAEPSGPAATGGALRAVGSPPATPVPTSGAGKRASIGRSRSSDHLATAAQPALGGASPKAGVGGTGSAGIASPLGAAGGKAAGGGSRFSRAIGELFGFGKTGGLSSSASSGPGTPVPTGAPAPAAAVTAAAGKAPPSLSVVTKPPPPPVSPSSATQATSAAATPVSMSMADESGSQGATPGKAVTGGPSSGSGGGSGSGILRKISDRMHGGSAGGGRPSGRAGSVTTTSPPTRPASPSAAGTSAVATAGTGMRGGSGGGGGPPTIRVIACLTRGDSDDSFAADEQVVEVGSGRPTPEAELHSVSALLVARRRAAKALEADLQAGGTGGASLAGLGDEGSLEALVAAADGLSPEQVSAVMSEIEAEQSERALALVRALSPVVFECFDVTAEALTAALAAEARRRARLKALFELRRVRAAVDLTALGPSAVEDDETLAMIDGDAGGAGGGLLGGRKLRVNDEAFRKLVRDVVRMPAFLGVTLFQRAVESSVACDAETALLQHGCVQLRAGAEPDRVPLQGGGGGLTRLGSTLSPTAVAIAQHHAHTGPSHHAHNRSFFFGGVSSAGGGGGGGGMSGLVPPPNTPSGAGLGGGLPRTSSAFGLTGASGTVSGIGHARTSSLARTMSASHGFGGDEARPMSPRLRYAHGLPGSFMIPPPGAGGGEGGTGGGGGVAYGGDPTSWQISFPLDPSEAYIRRANERIRAAVRMQTLAGTVGVLDFLRVWAPGLDEAPRDDKMLALLAPSPDPVLAVLTLEARTEIRRQMRTLKRSVPPPGAAPPAGTGTHGHPPAHPGLGAAPGAGHSRRNLTTTTGGFALPPEQGSRALPDAAVAAAAGGPSAAEVAAKVLSMARLQLLSLARKLLAAGVTTAPPPGRLVITDPDFPCMHRVAAADMAPCFEALVERHPDLATLRERPMQRGRYMSCVTSAVLASLPQGLSLQGVPVTEVRHSNLADSLWLCSTSSVVSIAPYSMRFYHSIEADFESAAAATKLADDKEAAAKLLASAPKNPASLRAARRSDFGFEMLGMLGGGASGGGVKGGRRESDGGVVGEPTAPAPTGRGAGAGLGLTINTGTGASGSTYDGHVEVVSSPNALFPGDAAASGGNAGGIGGGSGRPSAPVSPMGLGTPSHGGVPASPRQSRAVQKRLRMPDPDAGSDDKATVSLSAFMSHCDVSVTCTVLERVFAGVARPLMSGVRGRLSFEDFCWLCCEQNQRCTLSSQEYWLRCLDLDDDGVLGQQDLAAAYASKQASLTASGKNYQHMATVREAMEILMDAVNPADPYRGVTRLDIKRSGCGPILFDLLVAATAPRSITAASVNLRVQTSPHAVSGGCGEA